MYIDVSQLVCIFYSILKGKMSPISGNFSERAEDREHIKKLSIPFKSALKKKEVNHVL